MSEKLRQAFQDTTGEAQACPSSERMLASAMGDLPGTENETIILHLGECPACATAWRLAEDLSERDVPVPFHQRWTVQLVAAAILVTAVGLGYRYLAPDSETGAIYRTQEGDWLQSAIPEPEPLARDYLVLSWTAGPEGTVYDVQVMGEDLQPLARRLQITDTEYHVPPELVADLPSGSLLYWQVVAYLPDGRTVESISFMNRLE